MTMTPEQLEKVLAGPALQPPDNVTANFDKPESLEKPGLVVAIVLLVVIFLLFSMRVFVKVRITRDLSLEDYFLAFAWIVYSGGFTTVAVLVALNHVGTHQWNLTIKQLIEYLKIFNVGSILYNIIVLALKISIILQMVRFFVPQGVRNFTFWMSHALIWVNVVFYVTCTFLLIFACNPEAKYYDPTITEGHCLDSAAILISTAILNTLSDAMMIILPQRVIWDLSMARKRKIGVSAAFMIAMLALASSLVRLYFATLLKVNHDSSYNIGWLGIWTLPEITIGFLISCLPFLPKFIKYMCRKPVISKLVDKIVIGFRYSFGKNRHYSRQESSSTSQYPRPERPTRIITDVEFDELMVRTEISSLERIEPQYIHRPAQAHQNRKQSAPADSWPPKTDAYEREAIVWSSKDSSSHSTVNSDTDRIVVRTDVSISQESSHVRTDTQYSLK